MEALLQSLIAKYGYDVAVQLLGIDKQQGNPKYAISLGGQSINPMNMLKKAGLNKGIKSIMGGGMLGPGLLLGGALGLGYLTNPLREGSFNYNPNLQGQIDYLSGMDGMIGKNPNSGLMQYGPESVLRGQNVVSGFGTNDYGKQLQKYRDKYADTMSKERLEKLDQEIEDLTTNDFDEVDKFIETQTTTNNNDGGGGGGASDISDRNRGGYATDDTASFFYKGGIASL